MMQKNPMEKKQSRGKPEQEKLAQGKLISKKLTRRELVKSLRQDARIGISCDEEKKNQIIAAVLEKEIPVRKMGSAWEFLVSQAGFINKAVFFWQAVWILLFFYVVRDGTFFYVDNETLCVLSMAPPLLLLLTIEDLAHVYNRSMLEMEYATKYSLTKVVMGRMLILSIVNGVILLVGILFAKRQMGLALLETLAYSLTPLILMTFLLLTFMKKWKGEQLKYAGFSAYMILALSVVAGRMEGVNIYRQSVLWVWVLLGVCGIIAVIYQFRALMRHLGSFELLVNF